MDRVSEMWLMDALDRYTRPEKGNVYYACSNCESDVISGARRARVGYPLRIVSPPLPWVLAMNALVVHGSLATIVLRG